MADKQDEELLLMPEELGEETIKDIVASYGSEVMALVQRGELNKLPELTDMATAEIEAKVLKHRLDSPKLREKIDDGLRLYHACMGQDPRHTASQKVGLEHRKECLIKAHNEILALIPDAEQIDAMLVEARRTAKKKERERIRAIMHPHGIIHKWYHIDKADWQSQREYKSRTKYP